MRVRRMWPAALLVVAPVLAACGDDSEDPEADTTTSASPTETASDDTTTSASPTETTDAATTTAPPPTTTGAAPAGLPPACEAVTAEDLSSAYQIDYRSDGPSAGTTSEQGVEWKSDNCNFEAEGVAEAQVAFTQPGDFTKGDFQCPRPSDTFAIVEPVHDVVGAEEVWWKLSETPPLEATMRVCSPTLNIDIDIEYEGDYPGDPRNQSVALAEELLARHGS